MKQLWLQIIVISWILGFGIIGINIYYLSTGFVDWLLHNNLDPQGGKCIHWDHSISPRGYIYPRSHLSHHPERHCGDIHRTGEE